MPELPEVEVLVRHLAPLLKGRTIHALEVRRGRAIRPDAPKQFRRVLIGSTFKAVSRRGKYLVFRLTTAGRREEIRMLGHLGMTGRIYFQPDTGKLSRHAAVVFSLGRTRLIFEDVRGFGRMTLDTAPLSELGPEPLDSAFTIRHFSNALRRSRQAIKVRLLDQSLVAGVGNIYASEALFHARLSPRIAARRLTHEQVKRLVRSLRDVLADAIKFGSTLPLNWSGAGRVSGLFYYGLGAAARESHDERLRVYDRQDRPCVRCGTPVRRIVQAGRSTYYCPQCQRD